MIELESSWLGSEELDDSIGSSRSHYVVPAESYTMGCLIVLLLMGLHGRRGTLN